MLPWISAHPWMTFFIALGAIDAVRAILSPSCPPCPSVATTTPTLVSGMYVPFIGDVSRIPIPRGNGVFHGLVRA